MRRPVIGLCTALERAQWSVWDQQAVLLPRNYVEEVNRAGGLAVLLPPDARLVERPEEAIELLDGLLLAGGADIDPASYGQAPHAETQDSVPERDAFEIALTRAALERDLPLLGICRGMQLINVALGGTLNQHLPEHLGHEEHRRVIGTFDGSDHDVEVIDGTLAMDVIGAGVHGTKSHHHQGVEELGDGLRVGARSSLDGLVEAIELPDRSFVLGVQWHPEADPASHVVGALVAEADKHMRERVAEETAA
jgi:putative glutamine amidotransferase